jgi:hypothetical protein
MKAFKGTGRARFAVWDEVAGTLGPWYPFGNLVTMSMTPNSEKVEVESTDPDTAGQMIDSIAEGKPAKGKISSNRFDHRTLAILWQGTSTKQAVDAGNDPVASYTAVLGGSVRLPHRDFSDVEVTNEGATTTYEAGKDYEVDALGGFVTFLETGTVVDGSTVKISNSYAAQTGYTIAGSTEPSKVIALAFDGKNSFGGGHVAADVQKCTITPTSTFDFMSKDPAKGEFDIDPILVDGATSSYQVYVPNM